MTDVSVHTPSLADYARDQHTAADVVRAHANAQRGEVGDLTDTFGVIGADFLVAAAYTLDTRARRLDTLATRHGEQGDITDSAATVYLDADARAGHWLSRPPTDKPRDIGNHTEGLYL
ncbi:type VII secretion target [Gordonia sp. Z-3]|uniref:type VII secretion target n=1 Tax=Gordonia sp. Z-3 TaxID=3115408 RepID=UPI002E291D88|nr:type VII secretion target [Gordonia sp. Z-3]MED5801377.1 type VII secretion target [Gordonia sp. Z-3]